MSTDNINTPRYKIKYCIYIFALKKTLKGHKNDKVMHWEWEGIR